MQTRKYWGWGNVEYQLDPKAVEKSLNMIQIGYKS